ncbi:MAG: CvpA family protein [Chitinophagaceae bacterium]|nr:MAG: CvpA family protein [Chitinophagaceae bacterium]
MGIDLICLTLLVLALFKGLKKGLVVAGYLGASTNVSARWLPVLAFVLVFVAVLLLVRLGAKLIEGALSVVLLGWANKLGGVLFYALLYLFLFSILLFWADQLHLLRDSLKTSSISWPWLQPLAPKIIGAIGSVLPFFRDLFGQLSDFFGGVAQKAS